MKTSPLATSTPPQGSNLATNEQVGGDHYKNAAIQPMVFSHANGIPWAEGEIIKYVFRHRNKGGKKDLEKAAHLIQFLIEAEYPTGE